MHIIVQRTLSVLILLAILLTAFSLGANALAQKIAENEVDRFLTEIDNAIRAMDAERIEATLAPDAVFSFRLDTPEGKEFLQLNRDEYMANLNALLESLVGYEFEMEVIDIVIENQGERATVLLHVNERLVWTDRIQNSFAVESVTIERRDGRLLVVQVTGEVKVDEPIHSA